MMKLLRRGTTVELQLTYTLSPCCLMMLYLQCPGGGACGWWKGDIKVVRVTVMLP